MGLWKRIHQTWLDRTTPLEQKSTFHGLKTKTLWKQEGFAGIGETITCSENCLHSGVVRSVIDSTGRLKSEFAVVDGVRYPPCDKITLAAEMPVVQFSPDGSLWGYSAKRHEREFIVINGRESKAYEELLHPWFGFDLSFSEQGGHFAFGVRSKQKWFMVIDWKEMSHFDEIDNFRWSRSGQHYCYSAKVEGTECQVVDGNEGPFYQSVGWLQFSPKENHFAYSARSDKDYLVLLDHERIGGAYEGVEAIEFSPDGEKIAFWSKQTEMSFLMIDGRPSGIKVSPGKGGDRNWQVVFSPDGLHIAATGIHDGKVAVFKDGVQLGSYDSVGDLMFNIGNQLLYLAYHGNKRRWSLMVDGKEQGEYRFVCSLVTAPQGNRYAFQVSDENYYYMVIDGVPTKLKYDPGKDFKFLKFNQDASRFSYVANRGMRPREGGPQLYIVVDDKENGPYDIVAGTHFAGNNMLRAIALRSGEVELIEWYL